MHEYDGRDLGIRNEESVSDVLLTIDIKEILAMCTKKCILTLSKNTTHKNEVHAVRLLC